MAKPQNRSDLDRVLARRARVVAVVIAGTVVMWIGAQWLGGAIGLPVRYVFLFDFAAIGALVWALVVTVQIQRRRREAAEQDQGT
ncbi:MAG: DUF5337 domain-containing protein [Pseudomonadota bacterium]